MIQPAPWVCQADNSRFSHVYVSREVPVRKRKHSNDCCPALRDALRRDSGYVLVYDGPGASIYARR